MIFYVSQPMGFGHTQNLDSYYLEDSSYYSKPRGSFNVRSLRVEGVNPDSIKDNRLS